MKKKLKYFGIAQLFIVVLTFLFYGNIGVEPYINLSFYVGSAITFLGLLTYVVSGGFFDFFTENMRKFFVPRHLKKDAQDMRLPSQIFTFPYKPLIMFGLSILCCMLIVLFVYYL